MATYQKYNCFVEDVAEKKHNLASDVLKVALTNTAPLATHAVLADIGEIVAGNGYTAGGNQALQSSSSQTAGTYALSLSDPATWVASGGQVGPFRYAVLHNETAGGLLIGCWDYGQNITLNDGETFRVDLSAQVLTLS